MHDLENDLQVNKYCTHVYECITCMLPIHKLYEGIYVESGFKRYTLNPKP